MKIEIDVRPGQEKVILDGHEISGDDISQEIRVGTDHDVPFMTVTLTFFADTLVHTSPAGTTTTWENGTVIISGEDMADVMRTAGLDRQADERRDVEAEVDAEARRRVEAKMAEMNRGKRREP